MAKKLTVPVESLKTGLDVRDKHMKKRFKPKKYPNIIIKNAKGSLKSGKGSATIIITGIKKKISFQLKKLKNNHIQVKFVLNLPDFKFEDINYKGVGVEDKVKAKIVLPY